MAMVLLETIKNSKYGKAAAVAAVIVPVIIAFEGLKQSPYQYVMGRQIRFKIGLIRCKNVDKC